MPYNKLSVLKEFITRERENGKGLLDSNKAWKTMKQNTLERQTITQFTDIQIKNSTADLSLRFLRALAEFLAITKCSKRLSYLPNFLWTPVYGED